MCTGLKSAFRRHRHSSLGRLKAVLATIVLQIIQANARLAWSVDPGPIERRKMRWRGRAECESRRPYAGQTSSQTRQVIINYRYTRAFYMWHGRPGRELRRRLWHGEITRKMRVPQLLGSNRNLRKFDRPQGCARNVARNQQDSVRRGDHRDSARGAGVYMIRNHLRGIRVFPDRRSVTT